MAVLAFSAAKSLARLACAGEAHPRLFCDGAGDALLSVPAPVLTSALIGEVFVWAWGGLLWALCLRRPPSTAPRSEVVASNEARPPRQRSVTWRHSDAAPAGRTPGSAVKLPIAAFFLKQDAAPDFHSHLILARDGGFSDVPALFTYTKFLGALVSIAMIFVNVYSVLLWDIRRLKFKVTDVTDAADADQMLLTARLMQALAPDAPFPFEVILAACELLCVVHLLGSGVTLLVMILASQCLARWSAASFLLWHVLPALQSFSAMRLLHRISPAVLVADIEDLGEKCGALVRERAGPLRALGSIFYFLIARIMVLVIGFDAFILKLGAAAAHLQPGVPPLLAIGKLGLFLHQVMGIVQVQRFTLARLMLFIFGGEDAKMEPHENATLKVWMALLAKRMWQSFPGRPDRSISVMLTFDDVDFQRLVFSERL